LIDKPLARSKRHKKIKIIKTTTKGNDVVVVEKFEKQKQKGFDGMDR
jgi:hypothetical protein